MNVKVAIPRSGEDVAPCVGHCARMTIYSIVGGQVTEQVDFPLRSQEPLDRVRLLRDQGVDTIICGGVQDVLEECLHGCGIEVISWVTGRVDSLLELYLRGRLVSARIALARSCHQAEPSPSLSTSSSSVAGVRWMPRTSMLRMESAGEVLMKRATK